MQHSRILQGTKLDRCATCPVKTTGICARLDHETCQEIGMLSNTSQHAAGSEILAQGANIDKVGIIVTGLVKLVEISESGDENVIQLLHQGQFVGDPMAHESAFSWEAATDVELCWMQPVSLAGMLDENPQAQGAYLAELREQLLQGQLSIAALRGRSTLQRVAYWLVSQRRFQTEPGPLKLQFRLTRRDLASLLDMTVETLCRVLHQLQARKVIRMLAPDVVVIEDMATLRVLAKAQHERVKSALRSNGWEWGADVVPHTAVRRLVARP